MGNADGLLLGLALLAGLIAGPAGVVVAGLATVAMQALRRRPDLARVVVVLLVAIAGASRAALVSDDTAPRDLSRSAAAIGTVIAMPVNRGDGQDLLLRIDRAEIDGAWRPLHARVFVTTNDSRVNVGDRIWMAWSAQRADELAPGFGGYVRSRGAVAAGHAFAVRPEAAGTSWQRRFVQVRTALSDRLQRAAPGDAGALLAGMVTGDDGGLAKETRAAFRVTQTSHITAVSGSNVSMVVGLWAVLGASGWLRRRWWYQAAIAVTVIAYAILVGLEPPALRAAIVTLLAVLSVRFGRRPEPLTLLVLTGAAMAFADPRVTSSLGFQLSMASSVALVACLPHGGASAASWGRAIVTAVGCAQLATLPMQIATFGTWSPIGIVANVLIAPFIPAATAFGALAAVGGLAWSPLGGMLGWIAAWPAEAILLVVHRCALVARPLPLASAGNAGFLLVTVIALAILAALSPDARRSAGDVRDAWLTAPVQVALAAGSCAAGIVLTTVAIFVLT